jgi:histidine ammonia-lyase
MREIVVDGSALTVDDVVDVARGQARASLSPDAPRRMEASRSVVLAALSGDTPVYGVNTGFGALADTPVGVADLATLQRAIVRSHAAGVGEPLADEAVRAILLLRARTLAAGYSGVRAELPARLLELLSLDLLPVVPSKGSVGASGDLAQLAHLAEPLIGEGRLRSPGDPLAGRPAAEVLREHGLEPLTLAPKEGLSLVNGTEPMQALLAFSVHDADMLVQAADIACALSVEALLGTDRPYDERVQVIRPHPGQLVSAANLRARQVITIELGAIVDNPVIVPDGEVTAASLVSENNVLARPASVDTIPTSGKQEDHVSMGWTAVRKLREVVANVRACLAVEICCAAQGIDLRESVAQPSVPLRGVHDLVRSAVPRIDIDREVAPQLAAVDTLLPQICEVAAQGCPSFR